MKVFGIILNLIRLVSLVSLILVIISNGLTITK
jgi:hypothetical protein